MKLFFPEISYCFGGTPAVETTAAEAPSRRQRRRCMTQGGGSVKHWRPALAAIAEDGGAREVRRQRAESTVGAFRSEKKQLIKSKLAGKTRSDSYGSDYRESNHPMALPAFSAAPFLV